MTWAGRPSCEGDKQYLICNKDIGKQRQAESIWNKKVTGTQAEYPANPGAGLTMQKQMYYII
jgi:hypothetical protein